MGDIQRYIELVKKLCRAVETDHDSAVCYSAYTEDLVLQVFKGAKDHLKAIEKKENQLCKTFDCMQQEIDDLKNDLMSRSEAIEELKAENERLRFMVDNGLGYDDMTNDNKPEI